MQSCSQFHNQARCFINLTAACGYQGDSPGRIRITKFTVFATSLSTYVQPLLLRLTLKHLHIDTCVCVCPLQRLQTKVAQGHKNENRSIHIPHQAADYQKDTSFTRLHGEALLNASFTSTEITDSEVYQVNVTGLIFKSSYLNI